MGWGLLRLFPSFHSSQNISAWLKHASVIEYHIYIWQASLQLSCGDTCQIWMWFRESNRYFYKIEKILLAGEIIREIIEQSSSNPHH